ncbi:MAG: DEAD/DEAH box helicase [Anaerolineales bacterium]|nr:DEAD/DEAH box helicase [Anaerolineales bacterium]
MTTNISIDVNPHSFIVKGRAPELLENKRLKISFSRLACSIDADDLLIPYQKETQIQTLQEILRILTKFDYDATLSSNAEKEIENYNREEQLFGEFTTAAKSIRNDEFRKNPELVAKFDNFQKTLNNRLSRTLYPLQLLSAFHMTFAQNVCNFSVPGSGKTSIVFGAYAYLNSLPHEDPKHVDKLLVIGPISSFAPWENEYRDCFGKPVNSFRISGNNEITRDGKLEHLYSSNPSELTLIFHGGVDHYLSDIIDFLKRNKTMVIVDEAHRIKNPEGVWGQSVTEISKHAISRVVLTGTPVPNGYQDIYNLYKFIYPFKFKEILQFHYHNLEDMTKNSLPKSTRVQRLKENISPFFIRIKKRDLNLPPINEKIISVNMNALQREIYDFIESEYIPSFQKDSSATAKDVLNRAKLIRLRQASTNPSLLLRTLQESLEEFDPDYKLTQDIDEHIDDSEFIGKLKNYPNRETPEKFLEILQLISSNILPIGEKVIIWTIFVQNAEELQLYLENNKITSRLLIGKIEQTQREITIEKFNNPNNLEFQVVIANPFSVAESISLHKGCHSAIYLERDYNCSNFLQSKDRIHRVGLSENQETNYYYFISKNSIDEVINDRLRLKIERMEQIINDDIPLFSRIDNDDDTDVIKDLIANYAKRT